MRRHLTAGPVGARYAYRWLRCVKRGHADVYLVATWDGVLPEATDTALWAFEAPCKLLDIREGRMEVRTRMWAGHERWGPPRVRSPIRMFDHTADRVWGRRVARVVAALLRAAHRDGVPLRVEVDAG